MVKEAIAESGGERHGVVTRIAIQLGIGSESRHWVKQAEVDGGRRPGVTSEERRRIAELEREVRELRRANENPQERVSFLRELFRYRNNRRYAEPVIMPSGALSRTRIGGWRSA